MNPHRKAARIPPVVNELHSSVAEAFCLTRGGPLYRLQLRLDAAKDERTQVVRRALAATLLTWLPLLLLSAAQGLVFGKHLQVPFIKDFAVKVRFLIALPLLIVSVPCRVVIRCSSGRMQP